PKLMYAAVGNRVVLLIAQDISAAVGLVDEADLPNRPILLFKVRHDVLFAKTMRNKIELRVFGLPRRAAGGDLRRIGDEESARSAQRRLEMAGEALVRVVARRHGGGDGGELGEEKSEFV